MLFIFSLTAIGAFCVIAAIIEVFIGQKPTSDKRLSHKGQHRRYQR